MNLLLAASVLALAYESSIHPVDAKRARRVGRFRQRRQHRYRGVESASFHLLTKLRQDADFHRAIIAKATGGTGIRQGKEDLRVSSQEEEVALPKECVPSIVPADVGVLGDQPDLGVLSSNAKSSGSTASSTGSGCPEHYICIPRDADPPSSTSLAQMDGLCVPKSVARNLQERDFCECIESGYGTEESECFDTIIAGCTGDAPPSCVASDEAPYVAADCKYYECLDRSGGFANADDNKDVCFCQYYQSICYQCENGLVDPSLVICAEQESYCSIARCCELNETVGASICISSVQGDDSLEPTDEPTLEPEVVEPTASPVAATLPDPPIEKEDIEPTASPVADPNLDSPTADPPITTAIPTALSTTTGTANLVTTSTPTIAPSMVVEDSPVREPTSSNFGGETGISAPTEAVDTSASAEPTMPTENPPPPTSAAAPVASHMHAKIVIATALTVALASAASIVI